VNIATAQLIRSPATQPAGARSLAGSALVLPHLLRCRVLTWSEQRTELIRSAAEEESWQPTLSRDVRQFLRQLFQHRTPLTFVDLPSHVADEYRLYQVAVERASEMKELVAVCGGDQTPEEEIWARQLGVWVYLPGDNGLVGLRHLFGNAREAFAKQNLTFVELDVYR
jgi:hypothetical protein